MVCLYGTKRTEKLVRMFPRAGVNGVPIFKSSGHRSGGRPPSMLALGRHSLLLTDVLLWIVTVPLVIVWAVVNTVAWVYGSTQALPWSTVILLFFVWAVRKCP